jgi:hypothetical protein
MVYCRSNSTVTPGEMESPPSRKFDEASTSVDKRNAERAPDADGVVD